MELKRTDSGSPSQEIRATLQNTVETSIPDDEETKTKKTYVFKVNVLDNKVCPRHGRSLSEKGNAHVKAKAIANAHTKGGGNEY